MNEIGKNLKRIRLLNNLSLKDAGNLLHMSAPAIAKYEKGEIKPNSQKLIEFAKAYNVKTIEFLKSYNLPNMKFTSFRKRKRFTGQKLQLLEEIIQNEVAKYLEVMEINNTINNKIINIYNCDSFEDAEAAARKFRNDIKISSIQPISDLISTLENLGILIIQIENPNHQFDDFDGFSEFVNNIPVIVLLAGLNDGARQRFTIAHELGHLVLNITNNDLDEEKLCNRFASSLLMPKESRLKDLNIISEYTYKSLSIYLIKKFGKKNEPVHIESEISYQFKKIVHRLATDKIISLNKACEFLGVSVNEYYNEDNNYGY